MSQKTSDTPFPAYVIPSVFVLKLPYPPTINHYYLRTRTGQIFIGAKGKEFRKQVVEFLREIPDRQQTLGKEIRVQCWVEAHVPDKRRRDMDNIKKPLLDALTHAGVWEDDCQVDDCRVVRMPPTKGGFVRVHIGVL